MLRYFDSFQAQSEIAEVYYDYIAHEPEITERIQKSVNQIGGSLIDLDSVVKSPESIMNKLLRKHTGKGDPLDTFCQLTDIIRYTVIIPAEDMAAKTIKLLQFLELEGFKIIEIENWFGYPKAGTHYKGLHIGLQTSDGKRVELQIHSNESYMAKTHAHARYDVLKDRSGIYSKSQKKRARKAQRRLFDMVPDVPGLSRLETAIVAS